MWIDPRLRRQARNANTEDLSFRVSADAGALLASVRETIMEVVALWEADPPVVTSDGEPAPPAEMTAVAVPPDVVVSMGKFTDVAVSFEWLSRQLAARLPADTRLSALERTVLPSSTFGPVAALELRIALEATQVGSDWHVSPELARLADETAVEWLARFGPSTPLYLSPMSSRDVRVPRGEELATLSLQRDTFPTAILSSAFGKEFRMIFHWYPTAHLSFIIGTSDPNAFDWQPALDSLLAILRRLEPHTQMAVIQFTDTMLAVGPGAHGSRLLSLIPTRKFLNTKRERLLEKTGLVDAHGLSFLPTPPAGIDPTWQQTPFGHLTQVSAPDLSDWFAQFPDAATLTAGRHALAPLLQEPTPLV